MGDQGGDEDEGDTDGGGSAKTCYSLKARRWASVQADSERKRGEYTRA